MDEGADESFIAALLVEHDEHITDAAAKDVYVSDKLGAGKKSVCFGVGFINVEPKRREQDIIAFFERLGRRLR